MSDLKDRRVGLVTDKGATGYPLVPPYHPDVAYPEYPFGDVQNDRNWAYDLVRRLLRDLDLDSRRYGSAEWNPLGEYVSPGDTVVLKPNLVADRNWGGKSGLTDTDGLITHGSVIRAVSDYVYIALKGSGKIIVGDCPVQGTDWGKVVKLARLDHLRELYASRGLVFETADLRLVVARMEEGGVILARQAQNRMAEYLEIDLKEHSFLHPIIGDCNRFAVSGYGFGRMRHAHQEKRNMYLLPRAILTANCVINLPKLKFHQKAGVTCALKNLVGINGHKDYLPHFRMGIDEYPPGLGLMNKVYWGLQHVEWNQSRLFVRRFLHLLGRVVRQFFPRENLLVGQGAWHGNDTLWRTILDINRAFFYYSISEGKLLRNPQRKYFAIVDGIVGGEGESPLSPSSAHSCCVIGGNNPAAIDAVAILYMGLDFSAIPQVAHSFDSVEYPLASFGLEEILVVHNGEQLPYPTAIDGMVPVPFLPSAGWIGHVERSGLASPRQTNSRRVPARVGMDDGAESTGALE